MSLNDRSRPGERLAETRASRSFAEDSRSCGGPGARDRVIPVSGTPLGWATLRLKMMLDELRQELTPRENAVALAILSIEVRRRGYEAELRLARHELEHDLDGWRAAA